MKKGIITIFVTLFIFFSSVVPTFALDTVINSQCEYWIYDLMLQTVNENTSDATWGYVLDNSSNPTIGYYAMVLDIGSSAIYEYNVKPGETVYFRWGVSNFFQASGTTTVKTVVDGTVVNTSNYTTGSGDYNSGYSVFMVDDYTNTSNVTKTVTYSIRNGNSLTTTYIPVKCGLEVYFDDNVGEVTADTVVSIDLSNVENELTVIRNQILSNGADLDTITSAITSIQSNINSMLNPNFYNNFRNIPPDFYLSYAYFFNGFSATFSGTGYKAGPSNDYDSVLPFIAQGVRDTTYNATRSFNALNGDFLASFMFIYGYSAPTSVKVVYDTGTTDIMTKTSEKKVGNHIVVNYHLSVDYSKGAYFMPCFMMTDPGSLWNKSFIPLYIGYPYLYGDMTELQSNLSGIPLIQSSKADEVLRNDLKNTVNSLDSFESQQVESFSDHLANLPVFDFGSISDFRTTANFISTQMQNIYNSSDYIKYIFTAVLTFGIALVLIGRGLRR